MRLDHIAYRTNDRLKSSKFFIDAFGYRIQDEFEIKFQDGSCAKCIALEPPEKCLDNGDWSMYQTVGSLDKGIIRQEYHLPPEIFVSDGDKDSIVGKWVKDRGGIGGVHHMAYQVESVQDTMVEWKSKGYAEFTSDSPLVCPGLVQVFTKPSELTGIIYEFIERDGQGFCSSNVEKLMESTKGL